MTTAGQPPPAPLPPQIKESTGPINVVIMADSDIFDDRFWVHVENLYGKRVASPFADNGAFVLNAVENLMGSGDLISLRTRATNDRPFTVVKQIQADAQAQFQQEAEISPGTADCGSATAPRARTRRQRQRKAEYKPEHYSRTAG